jgi:hypothetical protein
MNDQDLKSYYTYYLNRKCLFCHKPIADQEHGSLFYCRRKILPDGTVGCCKDDFHIAKRKKVNPPYISIAKHHKTMDERIEYLFILKGERVTLEDINRYGIDLKRPVEIKRNAEGKITYFFVGYSITELNINLYKITKK